MSEHAPLQATPVQVLPSEAELLLDHEYDGIRELDNRLPGWWVWLFYLTTIFAGVYLTYYHVLHKGRLSHAAYDFEVAEAQRLGLGIHYQAWGGAVTPLTDAASLAQGQALFVKNCVVCHGEHAEGKIGPNLTDAFFLHGASFPEMVRTVEDGVPDKGMVTWKLQLSREDVRAVASYAFTLRGSNPANPKAPQGWTADGTPAPGTPANATPPRDPFTGAAAPTTAAAPASPATPPAAAASPATPPAAPTH